MIIMHNTNNKRAKETTSLQMYKTKSIVLLLYMHILHFLHPLMLNRFAGSPTLLVIDDHFPL